MKQRINFNDSWKFYAGDLAPHNPTDEWGGAKARAYSFGAVSETLDDSKWRTVKLPHDFVSEGEYIQRTNENTDMQRIPEMESIDSRHFAAGSIEKGVAWYRKKFNLSQYSKTRVYICFDGVYRNSDVYLNEYFVGTHTGGYDSFYYDITDFVNMDGDNVIAVRVDSTGREGWWYEGGGIYRNVWLELTDGVRIDAYGVHIIPEVDLESRNAVVKVNTSIENKLFEDRRIRVKNAVMSPSGEKIAEAERELDIPAWSDGKAHVSMAVDGAELWSLENPALYSLVTEVYAEGTLCDREIDSFGIRKMSFDCDKGFFLNGKHIKIKGLCCHHDHAGVGIGMTREIVEYRMKQLKSMGANAFRNAHYMSSTDLLDVCDRLGILVFDETRRMSSANEDIEALRTLVKHGRNHPSVFLWGIGNEEIFSQDRPETARTTMTMKAEVKKLDSTRPITSAVVCWNGRERFDNAEKYVDVTKNLDVMGFNYCSTAWDDYHVRMPKQPVIITEASANSGTRGCYSTDESRGQYYVFDPENESKCKSGKKAVKKDNGENMWKAFDEREYLSGIFLWTGIDYRGEPTPLAYPSVYSHFGILDYCGFPKDNYYYYKSWWQTEEDILHFFPHWNHADKIGEPINVYCYSNLDEAELFVNGKSMGKKKMEKNGYITWENVVYEPGEAKVCGYRDGAEVKTAVRETTGTPSRIELEPYSGKVQKGATAIVNIRITDDNGRTVPTADNEMRFEVSGGKLVGTGNGNPADHTSEKTAVRRAFNGLAQLIIDAEENGIMTVKASADSLYCGKCEIEVG